MNYSSPEDQQKEALAQVMGLPVNHKIVAVRPVKYELRIREENEARRARTLGY